jgi:hypothetical protein
MQWARDEMEVITDRWGLFDAVIPRVQLRTTAAAGPLRLGLWDGDNRVAGWSLPGLPADSILNVEGLSAIGFANGERRVLRNFLRGWDDDFPSRVTLPHGVYRLTVDQHPDRAVEVLVGVTLVGVSE